MIVRRLTQGDYPDYERFLSGRAATSMFLRSNARTAGLRRAILFTHAPAAERAYRALGFERIGDYHIALFEPGVRLGEVEPLSGS